MSEERLQHRWWSFGEDGVEIHYNTGMTIHVSWDSVGSWLKYWAGLAERFVATEETQQVVQQCKAWLGELSDEVQVQAALALLAADYKPRVIVEEVS